MTGKQAVYFKTMASIHSLYSVCLFMALQQRKYFMKPNVPRKQTVLQPVVWIANETTVHLWYYSP